MYLGRLLCVAFTLLGICPAQPNPGGAGDERIVATVNGESIGETAVIREADHRIDVAAARDAKQGLTFLESARDVMREQMWEEALNGLIERILIRQQLARDGVEITRQDAENAFVQKAAQRGHTREQALAQIAAEGMTYDWLLERIRWQEIGVEKLYRLHADAPKSLGEDEARKMYRDYPGEYEIPEERRVSHILIAARDGQGLMQKDAARRKAENLLAALKAGASFETLARENSDDAKSRDKGGDRGYSSRGIVLKPGDDPFGDAAFSLTGIGETSEVVRTSEGYHIIKLTDIRPRHRRPEAEVVKFLVEDFHHRQVGAFWSDFSPRLREKSEIVFTEAAKRAPPRLTPEQEELNRRIEEEIRRQQAAGTVSGELAAP